MKFCKFYCILLLIALNLNAGEYKAIDKIEATMNYELLDNKIKFSVKAENKYADAQGGISISFPQFKDIDRILNKSKYGFNSVKSYKAGNKLWSGKYKRSIYSDYLLVEGWNNKWKKYNRKEISVLIDTQGMKDITLFVRVALVKNKKEILFPTAGDTYDQQGYLVKVIHIDLTSKNKTAKRKNIQSNFLKTMINKKHIHSPNLITTTEKYLITYSNKDNTLKIWDKATTKLLKEFTEQDKLLQIMRVNDDLFYLRKEAFGKINLNDLKLTEIFTENGISFDNKIIFDGNIFYLGYSGTNGWGGSILKYNLTSKTHNEIGIGLPHVYSMPEFELSKDRKFIYFRPRSYEYSKQNKNTLVTWDHWIKFSVNDEGFGYFEQENKYIKYHPALSDFYKNKKESIKVGKIDSSLLIYADKVSDTTNKIKHFFQNIKRKPKDISRKDIYIERKRFKTDYTIDGEELVLHRDNSQKTIYKDILNYAASFWCEYKDSDYTTKNGHIVVRYVCTGGVPSVNYNIYNQNGKKVREISDKNLFVDKFNEGNLRIYNDKAYILHKNKIEVLNDDFITVKELINTLSNDIQYIENDQKNIIVYYNDGVAQYYNLMSSELIYTKYRFPDNANMILLEDGFFSGEGNFKEYIHFIDNKYKVYSINQFYDYFFRPDLVKLKLSGDEKEYQKQIKGMTYKEALKSPPPRLAFESINGEKVKISDFEYKPISTNKNKVKLTFNVTEQDGGVGLMRIYQEGKLIQTIGKGKINKQSANIDAILEQEKMDDKLHENQKIYLASLSKAVDHNLDLSIEETITKVEPAKVINHSGIYEIELELKSGKNEISIEAFNKTNTVTSYRENITVNANIPKINPKLYAIVAGVNEFEAPSVKNLKYSQNDAEAIKKAIENKMGTVFENVEISYLVGEEVTKENILKAAQDISKKAKLDDTILFYISTHGRAARGKLYLVPYNNKLVKNWIDFEQTFKAVQSVKALKQIFVIDACESGKANDIVSSVYDSRASVLAKSSGVHMLLATTKGTSAFEHPDPNVKNGVFTYHILEAINDSKTDSNSDKFISIIELSNKLKEPANNADYQYPIIRNVGNDVMIEKL